MTQPPLSHARLILIDFKRFQTFPDFRGFLEKQSNDPPNAHGRAGAAQFGENCLLLILKTFKPIQVFADFCDGTRR